MRLFFILNFLIFGFNVFSQNNLKDKKIQITDSTLILGVLLESNEVGQLNSVDCYMHSTEFLTQGTRVIVCGAIKCKNINSEFESKFYQIVYKSKSYYINAENVLVSKFSFDDILNTNDLTKDKLREYAIDNSKLFDLLFVDQAFKNLKGFKKFGLAIYNWDLYKESEYTEGSGVNIKVYNPTSKVIKYIWFSFIGFNPVDDKVIDYVSGKSIIIKKAVGPILSDDFAIYNFDYVWFTDLVETAKIYSIKVQYMDGSIIIIKNPQNIILNSSDRDILDDFYNENEK